MLIKANEFINFIAKDPIGWITTLNDIYDQDFSVTAPKTRA
jgi:hypothetical protein